MAHPRVMSGRALPHDVRWAAHGASPTPCRGPTSWPLACLGDGLWEAMERYLGHSIRFWAVSNALVPREGEFGSPEGPEPRSGLMSSNHGNMYPIDDICTRLASDNLIWGCPLREASGFARPCSFARASSPCSPDAAWATIIRRRAPQPRRLRPVLRCPRSLCLVPRPQVWSPGTPICSSRQFLRLPGRPPSPPAACRVGPTSTQAPARSQELPPAAM
jgi:hypothetical protein